MLDKQQQPTLHNTDKEILGQWEMLEIKKTQWGM
jgi:hypothetical protein